MQKDLNDMAVQTDVKLVISAEDRATKVLSKVSSSVSSMAGTAFKALGVASAVAGTALVAFGVSSVKAFIDAEKETAKFNAILGTMGAQGEAVKGKLQSLADETLNLGFDNEAAALSLAKFYTSTKSVEEATRLNNIAMDIARAKNIELDQAQKMVNMTLAGSTRELKAMGLEVDENATGIQNLASIEKLYAGQSEAFAQTTAGKIQILSQRFGELQETVGGVIAEALTPLLDKLVEFSKSEEGQKQIEAFTTALRDGIPQAWAVAKPVLEGLITIMKLIGKFIYYVVVAAQKFGEALGNASIWAEEKWGSFVSAIEKTYNKVIGWFEKIKASFKSITSLKFSFSGKSKEEGNDGEKQFGGSVMAGQKYLVGEKRPEVFVPSQSGNIRQMDQVGGSVTVNFNNVSVRNDNDLQMIVDAVKKTLNRDQELTRMGAFG